MNLVHRLFAPIKHIFSSLTSGKANRVDIRKIEKENEGVTNEEKENQNAMERVEAGETVWYRVPEAPWVRSSRLEGLSQSLIDHGIQPVHDPMTLTIKLGKTRAKEECERERGRW